MPTVGEAEGIKKAGREERVDSMWMAGIPIGQLVGYPFGASNSSAEHEMRLIDIGDTL